MPTDEIPDDIAALLRDRATDAPAVGAQARLWAKTMRSDGPGPGNGTAATATTATAAPAATPATPATVASTAALAGFAAGVLCGILGTYLVVTLLAAPPEVHVPVAVPAVQPSQPLAAVAPAPVAPPPRIVVVKPKPAPVATVIPASSAHGSHMTERATERAWLDAARTALSQDDLDSARSNLETAGARFPDGTLSEEREALAIYVLIARGDQKLAELAINTFRARRPGSPFILAIEEAMREMEANR